MGGKQQHSKREMKMRVFFLQNREDWKAMFLNALHLCINLFIVVLIVYNTTKFPHHAKALESQLEKCPLRRILVV
eukprot:COSAG06_NODE_288_length_18224_cov_8.849948_8_plen_75_part_00